MNNIIKKQINHKGGTKGLKYYNNGIEQKMYKPGEQPDGWVLGGLKYSKEKTELMLAKRGNISPMLTKQGHDNYYKSIKNVYGVDNIAKTDKAKQNTIKTNKAKYGVDYVMQNKEIKAKAEATCKERYGSTYYIGSKECRDKFKDSNLIKQLETKKKNGTFNSSKPEDEYYKLLIGKYGLDDVVRQYRDERYPFACDFYIKSLDLFIECNYTWTHGNHAFDKNNENDIKKLIEWEDKANEGKDYYKNAIYTWTKLDVRKQQIAKDNNLNYIVIYK